MKKWGFIFAAICSAGVAVAAGASDLWNEFQRRDQLKLDLYQGGALNFLKSFNYGTQNIVELEVLQPNALFVMELKNGDICLGDRVAMVVRCKNEIGVGAVHVDAKSGVTVATVAGVPEKAKDLYQEFSRREALIATPEQDAIINFLKSFAYDVQAVVELEILEGNTTFVMRDRGGDICFGDTVGMILRCKNERGLTGVTFQGDSD